MALMENRNGKYRIKFRFEGRQYSRSLKTGNEQKANLAKGQIERNLELVSLGLLQVPDACDVFDFFLTGKDQEKPSADARAKESKKQSAGTLSIERLFNMYFDAFLKESIEENSFSMLETHRNNLERLIGKRTKAATFGTDDIQKYVDKRAKEPGRRGKIQATTIRKEITTLSTIFKWAVSNGQPNRQRSSDRDVHHAEGLPRQQSWRLHRHDRFVHDEGPFDFSPHSPTFANSTRNTRLLPLRRATSPACASA